MEITIVRTKPVVQLKNTQSRVGKEYFFDAHWHKCIEDNGDRGLFEPLNTNLTIVPQMTIRFADIQMAPVRNEKSWPKDYTCNMLEPGAVSYTDVGQGVALLKKEDMDTWMSTFKNKPVIIDHKDVSPKNFKEEAVGYITDIYFNSATGWYDAKFIITDDEAHKLINNGWSVSCSFDVKDTAGGGEWHNIKYDEQITKGEGLHLALVQNPRYEDCRITKNNKVVTMFNSKAKVNASEDYDPKEYEIGMKEEQEHKDVTGGDPKLTAKIVEAHLKEDPHYYTKLKEALAMKNNDTNLSLMSTLQLDKYLGGLSDPGLQTIIDGEHDESIKKVAKMHQGDRATKKEEELMAQKKPEKKNMVELVTKKEGFMFGLFAKKQDKASIQNDKIDASKVFVKVDDEMVPLSTLMNSVGEDFELLQETDAVKINGKDVSIKDLVAAHKAKTNDDKKKKDDEKEEDPEEKKKKEDAKKCEDEEEKKKKEDAKKKEDEKEEEEDKEKKNTKKDFHLDLSNARNTVIDDKGSAPGGAYTREDKAARGKSIFGSKKKVK